MVFSEVYHFGDIAPNTTNQKFRFKLEPQPARILEVHAYGAPSINFDVEIYEREDYDRLSLVYEKLSVNLELHETLLPPSVLFHNEKRYIFFKINNNDTVNALKLRIRIVYEQIL